MLRIILLLTGLLYFGLCSAQTPPSASDIASYTGLHLAAHEGNLDEIQRLIADGADLNERDGAGRTPAHVAAFASNDAALTSLAKGGADLNLFGSNSPPLAA